MARQQRSKPYRRDPDNLKIDGGSEFVAILEFALTSGAWTEVVIPATPNDLGCKAFLAHERGGGDWRVGITDTPATHFTVRKGLPLSANIARQHGETIFWAQSVSASGTLEVILLD